MGGANVQTQRLPCRGPTDEEIRCLRARLKVGLAGREGQPTGSYCWVTRGDDYPGSYVPTSSTGEAAGSLSPHDYHYSSSCHHD
ncbi:unnamed protein product [Boreogadus saida]